MGRPPLQHFVIKMEEKRVVASTLGMKERQISARHANPGAFDPRKMAARFAGVNRWLMLLRESCSLQYEGCDWLEKEGEVRIGK